MNRQEFFAAIQQYEGHLTRQGNWAVAGLFVVILSPMLVVLALPAERVPSTIVWTIGLITTLVLYAYLLRVLSRRAAAKFGMTCTQCHSLLELRHIGFTAKCRACGAQAFTDEVSVD
jgi:hypothetical protein